MVILLALGMRLATEVQLPSTTLGTRPAASLGAAVSATTVAAAIERAVVDRMGDVRVVVRDVSTAVSDREGLVAAIEPGARLGHPIRFILSAAGTRLGSAVARLEVVGAVPHSRGAIARGEDITAADVDVAPIDIKNVLVRRLPGLDDVVGSRARRDIVAGELLTSALVAVPPAVRSGDEVRVVVTMGPVQVSGVGRASGSGHVGDLVRVRLGPEASPGHAAAPAKRKWLSARVVGRGTVEIAR